MAAREDTEYVVLGDEDVQGYPEEPYQPLDAEKLSKIQTWLRPTDYATDSSEYGKHRASHLAGTGAWALETDEYRTWLSSSDHGALWIKAIAGAGKSVLAAAIISELAKERAPVLYFFFRHIISANQTPLALVRDYLSQILEHSPELQCRLHTFVEDRRGLEGVSFDELWSIFVSALSGLPRVYCVVDALDEMDSEESFLSRLVSLAQKKPATIKVLMTSRPLPRIESVLRHPLVLQIPLYSRLVDPDIATYVRHRVANWAVPAAVRDRVQDTMSKKADGHFLYARLMMDDLHELTSRSPGDLLAAMENLPTPMADMYTQMLLQHSQRSGVPQQIQILLLQWVTRAEKPLRLLELSSMLEFKQKSLGIPKNTKSIVRGGCGPLLEILEDESVHPIHHSLTEFLYDGGREPGGFPVLDDDQTQRGMAITCLEYLASGWHRSGEATGNEDSSTLRLSFPFLGYAAKYWSKHLCKTKVNPQGSNLVEKVDGILVDDPTLRYSLLEVRQNNQSLSDLYSDPSSERSRLKSYTALHVAAREGLSSYVGHLIARGHPIESLDSDGKTSLGLAAKEGHEEVVATLIERGAKFNEADGVGHTPLHEAAMNNHYRVVKVLLAARVDPFTPKTKGDPGRFCGNMGSSLGDSPVMYACQRGHVETAQALVPYLRGEGLQQALFWSLEANQTNVAKLLLGVPGIDVNNVISGQTSFYLASRNRNIELMQLLRDMGADIFALSRAENGYRWTDNLHAFVAASPHGFGVADMVTLKAGFDILLDAGLDINSRGPNGCTILHLILEKSYRDSIDDILPYLFDRGLSATALNPYGSNALHLMSRAESPKVVDILISRGVDINLARRFDGKTPFLCAIKSGFEIANALLARGANPNFADAQGNTPLHHLCSPSFWDQGTELAQRLLDAGADVHQRNQDGNTPMHMNGSGGFRLLDLFMEHGFDLEAKNIDGETILYQSVHSTSPAAVEKLIKRGSSPLTRNAKGKPLIHKIASQIRVVGDNETLKLMRCFVEKGANPLEVDLEGNTLWHVAARLGPVHKQKAQLAVFNLLVEFGVSPLSRNNSGQTPLHIAFSVPGQHYPYGPVEFLIEHAKADIDVMDYNHIRPIHLAASFNIGLVCQLLSLGANVTAQTLEGQTPLMIACRARQSNVVCRLLDHYKDTGTGDLVDQTDKLGNTALYYACRAGRPEVVSMLVQAGASISHVNVKGHTMLRACVEYLDEKAIWDHATFHNGLRTSGAAYVLLSDPIRPHEAEHGTCDDPVRVRETVQHLLDAGIDIDFLLQSPFQVSSVGNPLIDAANKGLDPMVTELLVAQRTLVQAKKAEIERDSNDEESTSKRIHDEITVPQKQWQQVFDSFENRVRFLRARHLPEIIKETISSNDNNQGLVERLLKDDQETAIELVKELGGSFLELDEDGGNPLFQMVKWGFTNIMRKIGQDAVRMNHSWKVEMAALDFNWREERLKTLLHVALDRTTPNFDMVKLLVKEMRMDPNDSFKTGDYGSHLQSYIHFLAEPFYWWQTGALDVLLQNGGQVDGLDAEGQTPLVVAIRAAPDRHSPSRLRPSRLRAVEILLRHGADPNVTNKDGQTCLNLAARTPSYVQLLLKYGANPISGRSPFIFDAIIEQNVQAVQHMAEAGVNMNVLSSQGPELEDDDENSDKNEWIKMLKGYQAEDIHELAKTQYPLHIAAHRMFNRPQTIENATTIIKILLGAGADPLLVYENGSSILHSIIEQKGIVEPFLNLPRLDTEARDPQGRTLLLAACESRVRNSAHVAISNMLLDHGASTLATDNKGRNALHCVLSRTRLTESHGFEGTMAMIRPFIPTLVHTTDLEGRSPFHYALSNSQLRLIDVFLQHGADPTIPDPRDSTTALHHLARQMARWEEEPSPHFKQFLDQGLSIDARNHAGETPLFELVHCCAGDVFRYLTVFQDAEANFGVRNNDGESILHKLAALKTREPGRRHYSGAPGRVADLVKCFRWLEAQGLDVTWEDHQYRTCLDVAAATGADWMLELYKRK